MPEEEGKFPPYDHDPEPDLPPLHPVDPARLPTVIVEPEAAPFEAHVLDAPIVVAGVIERMSPEGDVSFNTKDGTRVDDDQRTWPLEAWQEVVVTVETTVKGPFKPGETINFRHLVAVPGFEWLPQDLVGRQIFLIGYDYVVTNAETAENVLMPTLSPQGTYIGVGEGVAVTLYSVSSETLFSELANDTDPYGSADRVSFDELISRALSPSSDRQDWLGGELPRRFYDDSPVSDTTVPNP